MKKIYVRVKSSKYPIYVGSNLLQKIQILHKQKLSGVKNVILISTNKVPKKYKLMVKKSFAKKNFISLDIKDGEKSKNIKNIIHINNKLSKNNFSRDDLIVSLGGGVVGDLSGFAASIFKRGIKFIQIPTTLLSQVDSSIGGKTGINNKYGKNLIGTFFQPDLVIIDLETLKTLPQRHMVAGFAEILKYSLIMNSKFFSWLEKNTKSILKRRDTNIISKAIIESCKCKAIIVKKDEKEKNIRAILNFGHTFAHALETKFNYSSKIIHGEAVLIGMIVACKISLNKKFLSIQDFERIINFYKVNKLNYNYKTFINKKNIKIFLKIIKNDKKFKGKKINLILLKKIGQSIIRSSDNNNSFMPLVK